VVDATATPVTTSPRECWYCPMSAAASQSFVIKSFNVPVTKDRTVSGFAVQISATDSSGSNGATFNSAPTVSSADLTKIGTIT